MRVYVHISFYNYIYLTQREVSRQTHTALDVLTLLRYLLYQRVKGSEIKSFTIVVSPRPL